MTRISIRHYYLRISQLSGLVIIIYCSGSCNEDCYLLILSLLASSITIKLYEDITMATNYTSVLVAILTCLDALLKESILSPPQSGHRHNTLYEAARMNQRIIFFLQSSFKFRYGALRTQKILNNEQSVSYTCQVLSVYSKFQYIH